MFRPLNHREVRFVEYRYFLEGTVLYRLISVLFLYDIVFDMTGQLKFFNGLWAILAVNDNINRSHSRRGGDELSLSLKL